MPHRFAAVLFLFVVLALPVVASDAPPVMPPDAALAILNNGNARFVNGLRQAHGPVSELRTALARDGQRPLAAVIACSDSREPVEFIFDQSVGGLFVIRTAGNTAGVQSLGSAQYAVHHLNVPLVIVMGHTRCGAVHAVAAKEHADGMLAAMLEPIGTVAADAPDGCDETTLTELNVRAAVASLLEHDPILVKKVEAGSTRVLAAIYDIESGAVRWLE